MKKIKFYYWIVTGIMVFLLSFLSLNALLVPQNAKEMFKHLGYPENLFILIVVARMLAVTLILLPGLKKLKEWAYAGLVFELAGAVYSHVNVYEKAIDLLPGTFAITILILVLLSYYLNASLKE